MLWPVSRLDARLASHPALFRLDRSSFLSRQSAHTNIFQRSDGSYRSSLRDGTHIGFCFEGGSV